VPHLPHASYGADFVTQICVTMVLQVLQYYTIVISLFKSIYSKKKLLDFKYIHWEFERSLTLLLRYCADKKQRQGWKSDSCGAG